MSKSRSDFVTNSSSSSFVMAFKDFPRVPEELIDKYPYLKACEEYMHDILTSVKDWYGETGETNVVHNAVELDAYFLRNYSGYGYYTYEDIEDGEENSLDKILEGNSRQKSVYNQCLKYINDGYRILFKEIDYEDYRRKEVIKALVYSDGTDFHPIEVDFD